MREPEREPEREPARVPVRVRVREPERELPKRELPVCRFVHLGTVSSSLGSVEEEERERESQLCLSVKGVK